MAWRSLTDNSVGRLNMGKYAIVLLFLSRHLSSHLSRCSCDWSDHLRNLRAFHWIFRYRDKKYIFIKSFSHRNVFIFWSAILMGKASPFSAPPPRRKAAHEFYYLFWLKSRPEQKSAYFGATTENAREKHGFGMKRERRKKVFLSPPNNENSVVSERTRARAAKTEA